MSTPPDAGRTSDAVRFMRAAAITLAVVIAVAGVLWLAAGWLGLLPASLKMRHAAQESTTGTAHARPPGTMWAAGELAAGWVNGRAPDRTEIAGAPALAVVWCDTDPEGLAALARAEELREAYASQGVFVFAIHAPDFSFSTDSAVVGRAARRLGVSVPIALDPESLVRAKLGASGTGACAIVSDTGGATEAPARSLAGLTLADARLRAMLNQLHPGRVVPGGIAPTASAPVAAPPPPIYLGVGRVPKGPLANAAPGRAAPFTAPFRFEVEGASRVPYPVGWWTPTSDGITASHGGAATFVALRYSGGALDAVISPPRGEKARVWVLCDERWAPGTTLGADARLDARGASYVEVDEPRLYHILRGAGSHVVKLSPDAAGVTLHALIVEPENQASAAR